MATSIWLSGKGPVEILPVPETIRDSENLKSGKLEWSSTTLSVEERRERLSYMSEELKFVRERYIRVAAIDTVIRAGV
jgi:hypothetical protein